MANKINKGEWAEFYAFIDILASGKLYAADENAEKVHEKFYNILSAIKDDIEYTRNEDTGNIVFEFNTNTFSIAIKDLGSILGTFFTSIKSGKKTFTIPELDPIIDKLKIKSVKQSSQAKGDIRLKVHDSLTGFTPIHSFSIKSYVGGAPTLLNASKGTIFTYDISPKLDNMTRDSLNNLKGNKAWLDSLIQGIYDNNSTCKFKKMSSDIFERNLQMIDFRLPEIISEIFLYSYLVPYKKLSSAVEKYLEFNPDEPENLIKHKVRELLVASALGMVPMTDWNGLDEANGGYIIVKDNAEVLCYHLYERNELKNYLYNNTRFETPSTSRYGIGQIKNLDSDSQIIELGLQIRF